MGRIIKLHEIEKILERIKIGRKSIVLVGGCFDILHVGHIKFLKEAKKGSDCLFLLLESDETVTRLKGKNRPYFPQKDRAEVLSSLKYVDYVILLNSIRKDQEYNKLISRIRPDVIAVTENDPILDKKKKQVEIIGGRLKIIPFIKTFSSSQLAKLLGIE